MGKRRNYLLLVIKGCCMGAADVVPGVSGGTIAFITGIYEELINSIKSINLTSLQLLFQGRFKEFWKKINGNFLISVVCGIGISIFSLAKLMNYLLSTHPIEIWSFFFGLIIASACWLPRKYVNGTFSHFWLWQQDVCLRIPLRCCLRPLLLRPGGSSCFREPLPSVP